MKLEIITLLICTILGRTSIRRKKPDSISEIFGSSNDSILYSGDGYKRKKRFHRKQKAIK